jgi:hypothetical protein
VDGAIIGGLIGLGGAEFHLPRATRNRRAACPLLGEAAAMMNGPPATPDNRIIGRAERQKSLPRLSPRCMTHGKGTPPAHRSGKVALKSLL